jgi:hypothetical protein
MDSQGREAIEMILLSMDAIARRRDIAANELAGLRTSLTRDLQPLLDTPLFIPAEKARLTRAGGRCPLDGEMLEFDPFSPRAHRCPRCDAVHDSDEHYRWWVMGYQLWLAERAVHAAVLNLLVPDEKLAGLAAGILEGVTERYSGYPNVDNVLGPSRPFFSTYLESIWLLQLCVAASALDQDASASTIVSEFRDEVAVPAAALIRSFDEGASNRQVWNAAALAAAGGLLGDQSLLAQGITGDAGLLAHLEHGLLPDGSWYEGENYHLFAHRGLWYGISLATAAGIDVDERLQARFDEGSAIPFVTALPDMTFPARRDSQFRVSLRQWRFAELAELGLARNRDDHRLTSALRNLYGDSAMPHDTRRERSTAEAERNGPPSALSRDDLGWRSLLFALPRLPDLTEFPSTSALLPAQGLGIIRRDEGRIYVALDYGHSGGGHGHPDRLNLLIADGDTRWLDDMGTGSYVDPVLHWYRSTLAHNAPVPGGRSQNRVNGELLAWADDGTTGWIEARADETAAGLGTIRTLIVGEDYLVDRLLWWSPTSTFIDLPLHVDGEVDDARWTHAEHRGGDGLEDGYRWLSDVEAASQMPDSMRIRAVADGASAECFLVPLAGSASLWRARAPGPPSAHGASSRFHFIRMEGDRGTFACVWSLRGNVTGARADGDAVIVQLRDGTHRHERTPDGWRVVVADESGAGAIVLGGELEQLHHSAPLYSSPPAGQSPFDIPVVPDDDFDSGVPVPALEFELAGPHYRRSETGWREAGSPRAVVALIATHARLIVEVSVSKKPPYFAPRRDENPLDNEHPDTNSDGVQLYVRSHAGSKVDEVASWILVPEENGVVRVTPRTAVAREVPLQARWRPTDDGWEVRAVLPSSSFASSGEFDLDVIVNEMPPGRERRRGQLVLSGGAGESVYLRGDRQPPSRLIPFRLRQQ